MGKKLSSLPPLKGQARFPGAPPPKPQDGKPIQKASSSKKNAVAQSFQSPEDWRASFNAVYGNKNASSSTSSTNSTSSAAGKAVNDDDDESSDEDDYDVFAANPPAIAPHPPRPPDNIPKSVVNKPFEETLARLSAELTELDPTSFQASVRERAYAFLRLGSPYKGGNRKDTFDVLKNDLQLTYVRGVKDEYDDKYVVFPCFYADTVVKLERALELPMSKKGLLAWCPDNVHPFRDSEAFKAGIRNEILRVISTYREDVKRKHERVGIKINPTIKTLPDTEEMIGRVINNLKAVRPNDWQRFKYDAEVMRTVYLQAQDVGVKSGLSPACVIGRALRYNLLMEAEVKTLITGDVVHLEAAKKIRDKMYATRQAALQRQKAERLARETAKEREREREDEEEGETMDETQEVERDSDDDEEEEEEEEEERKKRVGKLDYASMASMFNDLTRSAAKRGDFESGDDDDDDGDDGDHGTGNGTGNGTRLAGRASHASTSKRAPLFQDRSMRATVCRDCQSRIDEQFMDCACTANGKRWTKCTSCFYATSQETDTMADQPCGCSSRFVEYVAPEPEPVAQPSEARAPEAKPPSYAHRVDDSDDEDLDDDVSGGVVPRGTTDLYARLKAGRVGNMGGDSDSDSDLD